MVEIRTFEGSPEDMHDFVVGVWRNAYAGRMTFPLWTPEYFAWQFDLADAAVRDNQLAAYDGGQLVGTLFSIPLQFHTPRGEQAGSHGSWLTVHPEYRGQGIVPRLVEERVRRHHERGAGLIVSYRFSGSRHSLAERPRERDPRDHRYVRRVGFWARVLDCSRAARWNIRPVDRWLTRLGGWVLPPPQVRDQKTCVRPYTSGDLSQCLELVTRSLQHAELAIAWREDSLGRLVGERFGRCLVVEHDSIVQGLIAFHVLPFAGRSDEPVGIVDLMLLDQLSAADQQAIINSALLDMRDRGAILALYPRLDRQEASALRKAHFFPRSPDSSLVIQWVREPQLLGGRSDLRLLWR